MALQHYHFPLKLPSSCSERSLFLSPSVSFRNQATSAWFRPGTNGIVLRRSVNKGSLLRCSKSDQEFDLEEEIFEFMKNSTKPNVFPSREELLAAGRVDLVNAIVSEGGWLSAGWDSKEKVEEREEQEEYSRTNGSNGYVFKELDVSLGPEFRKVTSIFSNPSTSLSRSFSAQSHEGHHDDGGIEGMLSRLEKERSASYAVESREKEKAQPRREKERGGTRYSWESLTKIYGGDSWDSSVAVSDDRERTLLLPPLTKRVSFDASEKHVSVDLSEKGSCETRKIRGINILQDHHVADCGVNGCRVNGCSVDPVVPDVLLHKSAGICSNTRIDGSENKDERSVETEESARASYQDVIRTRIRELETKLSSMIHLVRSGTSDHKWTEVSDNSLDKLHDLSDAWEFKVTEILKSRAKLRSTRAKLAILEGKMALEIIEAQRVAEEKQQRIEKAQRALSFLRTACIVWSNSGKDVLLTGSFDGWTSQRRLERTSSGTSAIYLKLYPGQYEIKFIVDGIWRIDPLRPVVNNNGHENNLLVVS